MLDIHSPSPAIPLAKLFNMDTPSELAIVTGAIGSGKSTWCEKVAKRYQEAGHVVAGFISIADFSANRKVGIDLVDLGSGERRRLAEAQHEGSSVLMTDDWSFDAETLAWGNNSLQRLGPCDLFILDELGPLEFRRNEGLQEGFQVIERRQYRWAIVVVRPSLISQALLRWPGTQVFEICEVGREYDTYP